MNKQENGTSRAENWGRSGLAIVLLAAAAMPARAMLVTVFSPAAQAAEPFASAPVFAADAAAAASGSCRNSPQAVSALEGSIVEAKAQYWAYLIKQPAFSGSRADIPGADIANPEIKSFFYSRLRFWLEQETIPKLPSEALERLNDVSQTIHMMTVVCG
jgi:hypothetical protein